MKTLLLAFVLSLLGALQWVSNVVLPKPLPVAVSTTTTSQTAAIAASEIIPQEKKEVAKEKVVPKGKPAPSAPAVSEVPAPAAPNPPSPPVVEPPPPKPPEPTSDIASLIEQEVLAQTNAERAKDGLSPLLHDATLANIARAHSADMIENDYFSHEDRSGCSSSCRANAAGYRWSTIGENIYMMSGYKQSPEQAASMIVQGWMNSTGHRANMLREAFTNAGVGVSMQGNSIYTTTVYARPRVQ